MRIRLVSSDYVFEEASVSLMVNGPGEAGQWAGSALPLKNGEISGPALVVGPVTGFVTNCSARMRSGERLVGTTFTFRAVVEEQDVVNDAKDVSLEGLQPVRLELASKALTPERNIVGLTTREGTLERQLDERGRADFLLLPGTYCAYRFGGAPQGTEFTVTDGQPKTIKL
jgi:hypothetical protein